MNPHRFPGGMHLLSLSLAAVVMPYALAFAGPPAIVQTTTGPQTGAQLQSSSPVGAMRSGVQDPAVEQQRRMRHLRQQVKLPASANLPSAAQLRTLLPGINGLNGHD